jgi:hypothetical protein
MGPSHSVDGAAAIGEDTKLELAVTLRDKDEILGAMLA